MGETKSELPEEIYQHWIHSYEEDSEDVKVFHPENYDFPLSRGRKSFEFKKDGKFLRYDIGPVDVPKKIIGEWKTPRKNRIYVLYSVPNLSQDSFDIIFCDKNVLKIKMKRNEPRK